ncbi:N-6 DNA methylase [Acidiphilium sp. PA]|uniref:Eco57I restriction-modification methylase domain-containing protein n=1 Tax=Acidiphilium sp. PA TaxID=2871705 RepID=UPI0022431296|nr:DNA methyltransferase [Acidiphilium sp. PA]MCW8307625.1 N-6 DNA methylase [Acidiphilium sp. PA]
MAAEIYRDPDLEWLDHVPPVGLVVAPTLLKELGLLPLRQTPIDTGQVAEIIGSELSKPALTDPWAFVEQVLGWEARHVAGAPGGPAVPDELLVALPEHGTTLRPTWGVAELGDGDRRWQLLVRIEAPGVDPDARNALDGWEATPHQRFERLLRDTGVFAGLLISERDERKDGEVRYYPEFRLIYAPRGETSGHQSFPIRPMATVAGRPMLGGLKLLLDRFRLFSDADDRRLPALLKHSRDAQALVSTALAEQVLGALHELLRGLDSAEPVLVRELAASRPDHLYEGLLTVLMRLVFVLYAEDRDLLPSRSDARAREIYETSYSVRGLYAKLTEDATLNPDTMDERRGGWGGLLALFRLIHKGHKTGFVQARGGKLFDPDEFPFIEGRASKDESARILTVSDGCLLRILEGLMTLKLRGAERERLSYRTLDVEQIGSVYETVMGFTVEAAKSRVLAIKAGKNNKTPVFVALDDLLAKKGKDRIKELKEDVGRALTAAQSKPVEDAKSVEDLVAALDGMVDERGSPKKRVAASGTPILQPTGERRRTGSHYTPRSLTAPIVKYALEPAFDRLGPDARPDEVLNLKVCDPAMGSGAFLVEACRALGERLVAAWARWPETRPTIPADEDEELHARRLVAQRCLYGVDKNPRAVDLARLSLWLATLARDHEFTFLDHALKYGDSLVGLSRRQIGALTWESVAAGTQSTMLELLVKQRFEEAVRGRDEIRSAPDDVVRAIQEQRHKFLEQKTDEVRLAGDAVIAAFFAGDKPKARRESLARVEHDVGKFPPDWDIARQLRAALLREPHAIRPFHWELEFPEVFARQDGGFDAIVGNPPFAGKNTIIGGNSKNYLPWLQTLHEGAHGNADLVAHFFRRAFGLLRQDGVFGLIATNTIGQGDTRASGLAWILANGGAILRAQRRLKWPGEAAVVVSVVHLAKGTAPQPSLDGKSVRRISAYLVEGNLDVSPAPLAANAKKAFKGSELQGMGFSIDDELASSSSALSIAEMESLLQRKPNLSSRIKPFLGGFELNNDPRQEHSRYAINISDMSIDAARLQFPELVEIIERYVKPERDMLKGNNDAIRRRENWWRWSRSTPELYETICNIERVVATIFTSPHSCFSIINTKQYFANSVIVFAMPVFESFAVLQSRCHEVWVRTFSSTMKDDLRYAPSDCFRSFPFPADFENSVALKHAGQAYHTFRAQMMINRNEGLTKTYNRLHARGENAADIARLRELHHEMGVAVLSAYGWDDLAGRAAAEFVEQDADDGKIPKTRLDWPAEFKDEVLARLLALNVERAAAERAAGVRAAPDDEEIDDDEDAD